MCPASFITRLFVDRERRHPRLVSPIMTCTAGICLIAGAACRPAADEGPAPGAADGKSGTPVVYVVNYPLQYFADRIGGERVDVHFPAPGDGDPAFWKPDASTIGAYQGADLILLNGADYAKWTATATLPLAKCAYTTAAVKDEYIDAAHSPDHSHGPGEAHSHHGVAFTTWLDPRIATAQARAVRNALAEVLPDEKGALDENLAGLEKDLGELDQQLESIVGDENQIPLVASHPVYQYLARRYDLNLKSLHWEPEEFPDEKAWQEFEKLLADHPARWLVWEGEPLEKTTARLRELGLESVVFDPCGNRPDSGDYLSVMRENLSGLKRVFAAPVERSGE